MQKHIDIAQKLNVTYCIPFWLRDEQVKYSTNRIKARIEPVYDKRPDPIAVVCYGPSLNDTWEKIKEFKYIITCSGAHKFLIDRGIIPIWHCEVDPREHKIQLIGKPHKDVEYLIASTCHKAVWDHLEGYNVKLWHVFANEDDALRLLPPNEWALTGGSSVGLRAMTIARFLGFTDLHIFAMDGCEGPSGKHAGSHPNQPEGYSIVTYNGKEFRTTASILECAKQTWHELDQMPDVKATFYGDGLVQEMSKSYVPKYGEGTKSTIGINKPELISKEYIDLNSKLHEDNLGYGVGGGKHSQTVIKLAESLKTTSILDYGCLPSFMKVETEDGPKTIEWIVKNKYNGKVLSLQEGKFAWNRVINHLVRKNKHAKKWVKVKTEASHRSKLVCTDDHECAALSDILRPEISFLPAKDMLGMFSVRLPSVKNHSNENALYNHDQISALLGILMGDGGIRKDGVFYVTHGETQEDYIRWINNFLAGQIYDHVSQGRKKDCKGFRLVCPVNAQTRFLRKLIYPNGKRTCSNVLDYLNEISLAFWYMDDGTLHIPSKSKDGKNTRQPYIILNTQGFSKHDHKLICEWLLKKWSINASIDNYTRDQKEYQVIRLGVEDSRKFWSLVAPYIHKTMDYKLPEKFRSNIKYSLNPETLSFSASLVTEILPYDSRGHYRLLYDIEVEKAHNFVANYSVVHNCGKGYLAKSLPFPIWEYDPAVPGKTESPRPADIVICSDVLEHIEPEKLLFVLDDLQRCVKKVGYFVIHTGAAVKQYADGRNTHLIQKDRVWWKKKLAKFFDIGSIIERLPELHVVVGPKQTKKKKIRVGSEFTSKQV